MKFVLLFSITSLAVVAAIPVPSPPAGSGATNLDEPWLDVLKSEIGTALQGKLVQVLTSGASKSSKAALKETIEFEDPWLFPDTKHKVWKLFQDGEINTFHPTVYGLSNVQVNDFLLNLATRQVRMSIRFPMVTWQGEYNLWIEKYGFITPGPYETRRGEGHYSHTFKNVDYESTFELSTHPTGRFAISNVSSRLSFERCAVWSENYTINSRPIANWDAVSVSWKESFDSQWETNRVIVEEGLSFLISTVMGWPWQLSEPEVVDLFEYWGAEVIGK